MSEHDIATARLTLRWHGRDIVKEISIEPHQARCFAPLHKDHDFPGMPGAYREAMGQSEERRRLATLIANALTSAIMEEVTSQDPRNGYTPNENRAFYGRGSAAVEETASKPWITADQIKEITERNGTFTGGFTAYIIRNLESANTKEFAADLTEDEACALCMAAGVPYEIEPVTLRMKFGPCGLHKQHGRWTVAIAPRTRFPR
jgi:hypothetical protein